jgi:hypothetical protein
MEKEKEFYYNLKRGEKYLMQSRKKNRKISDVLEDLTNSLENYNLARKFADDEYEKKLEYKIKDIEEELRNLRNITGLGNKVYSYFSIASLFLALIFISSTITGNAVGESMLNDNFLLGICFFICGLVLAFFYAKIKRT